LQVLGKHYVTLLSKKFLAFPFVVSVGKNHFLLPPFSTETDVHPLLYDERFPWFSRGWSLPPFADLSGCEAVFFSESLPSLEQCREGLTVPPSLSPSIREREEERSPLPPYVPSKILSLSP